MKSVGLFSLVFGFLFLVACQQSPLNPSSGPDKPHFQLYNSVSDNGFKEATQAAQEGKAFTASIRFNNADMGLKKSTEESPETEAIDIQIQFTGSEYLVQNPESNEWVTLGQVLAEEAEDEVQLPLAKRAIEDEPLELPEKTVVAEGNGDVLILAGTLVAGTGVLLWKVGKWGWKKLFGKKKPAVRDPGIKIDPKITNQMNKRGWTDNQVQETIKNPSKTAQAIDRTANNEPATAYFDKTGHYVVRNNKTGNIVQVSNRNDPNWVVDPSFKP